MAPCFRTAKGCVEGLYRFAQGDDGRPGETSAAERQIKLIARQGDTTPFEPFEPSEPFSHPPLSEANTTLLHILPPKAALSLYSCI
jgi:hypothetical protein